MIDENDITVLNGTIIFLKTDSYISGFNWDISIKSLEKIKDFLEKIINDK